jgi:flagellar motor switch protein FliN/FliY
MSKLSQSEIDALFAQYAAGGATATPAPTLPSEDPVPLAAEEVPAPASFPELQVGPSQPGQEAPIGLLAEVEVEVAVRLGRTRRSIREILALASGSVLELDNLAGEAVDVLVNGLLVARGEVVVVGENYGVRIIELVSPQGGPSI